MIKRPVPLTLTARRTPSKLTYWRTLLHRHTLGLGLLDQVGKPVLGHQERARSMSGGESPPDDLTLPARYSPRAGSTLVRKATLVRPK